MSIQPDPDLWQLSVELALPEADEIEPIFEDIQLTTSLVEVVPDGSRWRLDILFDHKPDAVFTDRIPDRFDYVLAPLEQRDWVSESQKQLPPVEAGRFYIHGSHDPAHKLCSKHDLVIEAGRAFGTGLHETTYGCLLALNSLKKKKEIYNALDVGCGSGVLSLVMVKNWGRKVLVSDIDPEAVAVTRENAAQNRLSPYIQAIHATGLNSREIRKKAPFDLIVANILAWPLVALAPEMAKSLKPDGVFVLSGLLSKQENMVRHAYALHGFHLVERFEVGPWNTLILKQ